MGQRRHPRQAEPQHVEIILQAGAAFQALVHGKPRRLVDDQHQPVAVEEPAPYVFRCHDGTGITAAAMNDSTDQSAEAAGKKNWWGRLAGGLKRTSSALGSSIDNLINNKQPLDPAKLDDIE